MLELSKKSFVIEICKSLLYFRAAIIALLQSMDNYMVDDEVKTVSLLHRNMLTN